ncbi:MAG: SAM-dependent methyltransferase [Candidatus Hodarchaeales archaeon]
MEFQTADDILDFLRAYIASAALGTALELQLFWQLAEMPMKVQEIAQKHDIPLGRCRAWLGLLMGLGLLEQQDEAYVPSSVARSAILETYSPDTWVFIAQQTRERYPAGTDLKSHISHPNSVWDAQGIEPPNWFTQLSEQKRAERFTRALYDFHQVLADKLAKALDLTGVQRVMDLGGGSGVMSLALLRQYPQLTAVVVDIETVCIVGRKIAAETPMANRITYQVADFLQEPLPVGFDMILQCDVGFHNEEMFSKLRGSLNEGGRLVIVTNLDGFSAWLTHSEKLPPLQRLLTIFLGSLEGSKTATPDTTGDVKERLAKAGFQDITEQVLDDGTVVIQARV